MVDVLTLAGIAVFVVVALLVFKVVKGVVQTLLSLLAVLILGIAALVGVVVIDAMSLQDSLDERTYLVAQGSTIVAGMHDGEPLTDEQLESAQQKITNNDFAEGELYIVIDSALLGEVAAEEPFDTPSSLVLARGLKEGTVTLYPEPLFARVMKYVPLAAVKSVVSRVLEAGGAQGASS